MRAGNNLIDLVETDSKPDIENPNLAHFCLQIENQEDFSILKDYFSSHDINAERYGERYGAAGNTPSFYLKDPQGNELELKYVSE